MQVPMGMLGRMLDRHVQGSKPFSLHFVGDQPALGQSERIDARLNGRQIGASIHQRRQRHIAADSAQAIKVGQFHAGSIRRGPDCENREK